MTCHLGLTLRLHAGAAIAIGPGKADLLLRMGKATESKLTDGSTRFFAELNLELNGWSALAPFGYGEPWGYLGRHFMRNLARNDGRPTIWPHIAHSKSQPPSVSPDGGSSDRCVERPPGP